MIASVRIKQKSSFVVVVRILFCFIKLIRSCWVIYCVVVFIREQIKTKVMVAIGSILIDIDTRLTKAWTAIDRQAVIWRSDMTDKMKCSFFQAVVMSILLYGCTTSTLTKRMEEKLDDNYTRILQAILNKSWRQHSTKHQLYGHLPPIMKTIKVRWTRHAGHCWRSRDELISDVLLWTPSHGRAKAEQPVRTYIQQLCVDMGCSPEDLQEAIKYREGWRERVRDIRAGGTTWWWWWWLLLLILGELNLLKFKMHSFKSHNLNLVYFCSVIL